MAAIPTLEEKLVSASAWVGEEFDMIVDLAADLGCETMVVTGPGLSFRLDGHVVVRADPKLYSIAVGLPDRMRTEVAALTGALRPQSGLAWFNYRPDVADRETIERLVGLSITGIDPTSTRRGTTTAEPSDATDSTPEDDADLTLILAVVRAFHDHEQTTGSPTATRALRETLFSRWENPRLPTGGRRSLLLPHSPAARERRREQGNVGLVYEHVAPVSPVIRGLLAHPPSDEAALRTILESTADRVIITREEDARLNAAGFRDRAPDPPDPWSRYSALGLQQSDFVPAADSPW